jgi:CBS domain-containing protein
MFCRDVMKLTVECLRPTESVQAAAKRMRQMNIGFLPVCDAGTRVLGTLTDRDIAIRVVAEARTPDTPVAHVMTREAVSCNPDDDIKRAEELMVAHQKSRLLCCDEDGNLVGVITVSDLAGVANGAAVAEILREVTRRVSGNQVRG